MKRALTSVVVLVALLCGSVVATTSRAQSIGRDPRNCRSPIDSTHPKRSCVYVAAIVALKRAMAIRERAPGWDSDITCIPSAPHNFLFVRCSWHDGVETGKAVVSWKPPAFVAKVTVLSLVCQATGANGEALHIRGCTRTVND